MKLVDNGLVEAGIKQIDGLLEAFPLALTGRCVGKPSLLTMLPTKLPNALIINCDLQNSGYASFYGNIIEQWAQVCVQRGISPPAQLMAKIPDSPESFNQWMRSLEDSLSSDNVWHSGAARIERIIFCLDGFERLEELFTGKELKRLAGVLRAITQHLTRVRLIMITELPFCQWSSLWQDHLIHCREIRLPELS